MTDGRARCPACAAGPFNGSEMYTHIATTCPCVPPRFGTSIPGGLRVQRRAGQAITIGEGATATDVVVDAVRGRVVTIRVRGPLPAIRKESGPFDAVRRGVR